MELTVKDLISGSCSNEFDDKVFFYASLVKKENDIIKIYVNNNNLATTSTSFDVTTVSELRKTDKNYKSHLTDGLKDVLISSGSFLFINSKLVLTKRTHDAPIDPNKWTSPAGRCDRTPLTTALKETAEEINVYCKASGTYIYPKGAENFIKNKDNISFIPYEKSSELFKINLNKVEFYLDGKLEEKSELWFYYDKENNTFEFRLPIFYSLDEKNIEVNNPEYPDTKTKLFDITALPKDEDLVSSIKQLKDSLRHPPHIFYLTGLSLDKQKWDKTYSDALYDDTDYGDFVDFLNKEVKSLNFIFTKRYLFLTIFYFLIVYSIKATEWLEKLDNFISFHFFYFNFTDSNLFEAIKHHNSPIFYISILVIPIVLPCLFNLWKKRSLGYIKIKEMINNYMDSSDLLRFLLNDKKLIKNAFKSFLKESEKVDFKSKLFGLYLSHQGDVRGLYPLSSIGSESNKFTVSWAYSDLVYYENKFIDVVSLTIPNYFLKKQKWSKKREIKKYLKQKYIFHGLEVLLARGLVNCSEEIGKLQSEERKKKISYLAKKLNGTNLFGISLLSSILYYLADSFGESVISIDDKENIHWTNYLLELAGKPEVGNSGKEGKESIKIKLIDDNDISKNSKVINAFTKLIKIIKIFPKNHIKTTGLFKLFGFYSSIELRIPVKLYLSLPIDLNKKEKYNFEDIVPPGIIPNNYKNIPGEKIILSVGGAEHNRALVYLVNKHRKTCKEKRFIGFCDNVFDLDWLENERRAFLMGLNGPVSGGNSKYFNARTIDNDNFSTGHYIELISFKVEGYRVLSVYGLSALASKLMLEYITARTISYKKGTSLYKCLIGEHLSRKYKNKDFCVLFELKEKPIDMEKEIFNILDGEDTFTFLQRKELNFEILDKLLTYYNDNIVE